jgi:glycosyltransferase involved in cell wall biosynthesis
MVRVTVLIPTHNRPNFLRECLHSLKEQTIREWRAIVYDDGGCSRSDAVVSGFDPRISYIWGVHRGMRPTFNRLLLLWDTGGYACFLDDDDVLTRDSLERRADYLDEHPECDLVMADLMYWDGYNNLGVRKRNPADFPEDFAEWSDHTNTASLMFREVVKSHPYSERYTSNADDLLWQYKMKVAGLKFGYLPEVVMKYRLHATNDSGAAHKATYAPGVIEAERLAMREEAAAWRAAHFGLHASIGSG